MAKASVNGEQRLESTFTHHYLYYRSCARLLCFHSSVVRGRLIKIIELESDGVRLRGKNSYTRNPPHANDELVSIILVFTL